MQIFHCATFCHLSWKTSDILVFYLRIDASVSDHLVRSEMSSDQLTGGHYSKLQWNVWNSSRSHFSFFHKCSDPTTWPDLPDCLSGDNVT